MRENTALPSTKKQLQHLNSMRFKCCFTALLPNVKPTSAMATQIFSAARLSSHKCSTDELLKLIVKVIKKVCESQLELRLTVCLSGHTVRDV
jgi:hypothetical protein